MNTESITQFMLTVWSLSTTLVSTLLLGIPALLVTLVDRTGRVPYRIGQLWARFILRTNGGRLPVEGMGNISGKESYVFISNHQSNLAGLAEATPLL